MISELRHCPAPAKLNLFLHVTGRRADGYHLLETVFELIDLCDTLHFRLLEDGRIERIRPLPGVAPEDDLTVRAARLLAAESGCRLGVGIEVEKRIPMGGGLGGGSSDAATTLLALNRLWELDWPADRLAALALRLGADVPVFVHGRSAYATGIGERLRPLALPRRWYVVLSPRVSVPTAGGFCIARFDTEHETPENPRSFAGQLGVSRKERPSERRGGAATQGCRGAGSPEGGRQGSRIAGVAGPDDRLGCLRVPSV